MPVLKRCVKYLTQFPTASLLIPREQSATEPVLTAWTDSDWAGDVQARKSTSGGVITYCGAALCHWSKTQSNIALSSGEAELNACVKGISELIGLGQLISET